MEGGLLELRSLGGRASGLLLVGLLVSVACQTGCAPKGDLTTAPVSGKITYKGQPVPTGTIMFVPGEGPAATGEIAKDGSYTLSTYSNGDGAVLGAHKVSITALQNVGAGLPEQKSGTPPSLIPKKYISDMTSGLTAEVKQTDNVVNFDLRD
jgi:hypothetical protein